MRATPRLAVALLWRLPFAFLHATLNLGWMVLHGVASIFADLRDEVAEVLDVNYERRTKERKKADRKDTFAASVGKSIERLR